MTSDQRLEDTREPDTRGEDKYEQLVDAFDAGRLDAVFAKWAVKYRPSYTWASITSTSNDRAARTIFQYYAAAIEWRGTFGDWLVKGGTDLRADAIAAILRDEDARGAMREDTFGWRPVQEFLAYQWAQGARS